MRGSPRPILKEQAARHRGRSGGPRRRRGCLRSWTHAASTILRRRDKNAESVGQEGSAFEQRCCCIYCVRRDEGRVQRLLKLQPSSGVVIVLPHLGRDPLAILCSLSSIYLSVRLLPYSSCVKSLDNPTFSVLPILFSSPQQMNHRKVTMGSSSF